MRKARDRIKSALAASNGDSNVSRTDSLAQPDSPAPPDSPAADEGKDVDWTRKKQARPDSRYIRLRQELKQDHGHRMASGTKHAGVRRAGRQGREASLLLSVMTIHLF